MFTLDGQLVITGGVMSCKVIICIQLLAFPQLSVAVHVRVIRLLPAQPPGVITSTYVNTGVGSQLSVAVTVPVDAGVIGSWQLIAISAGQVNKGGVTS